MVKTASRLLAGTLAVLLAACGGNDDTGTVTLKLTDAPGDFTAAVVTIEKVYLAGGDETDAPVVLFEGKRTVDLLSLANETTDLVTDAVVPSGRYGQLRFVITGGYVAVEQEDGVAI
ncbi:MAG TPA: DUF4382 domain-containing protein, partial [Anaeromyxobacteraceae bacterium]|nr:DUF4382 domain-containing protein [Anaeromyxobacteraceae bacterium]